MNNLGISAFVIILFVGIMFYMSQQKFKNKMLCTFIRPNRQKIEAWVPLTARQIVWDNGKHGIEQYECDPDCITMMWYTRGFNRFFPVLIPSLDFKWDTPNPQNPKTFQSTWHTPAVRYAAWNEHQHVAFAKGTAAAVGKKSRFPEWLFPVITAVLIIIVLFVVWNGMSGLDERMFYLEQQLKLIR